MKASTVARQVAVGTVAGVLSMVIVEYLRGAIERQRGQ